MKNIQASKISTPTTKIIAKFDSDTSNQYFSLRDIEALQDVVEEKFVPTVVLYNKSTLTENLTGQ